MAVKRGGLGKGLDSMIPVLDSTATKKKTGRTAIDKEALQNAAKEAHKHQKEKMEFEGKPGEQVQIVSRAGNSRENSLMPMHFRNWQNLLSSLVYFSHYWFRKRKTIMRLLPGSADGELLNWQDSRRFL